MAQIISLPKAPASGGGSEEPDAVDTTYTPGDGDDWGFYGSPTQVAEAMDALADRVKALTTYNVNTETKSFTQGVGNIDLAYKSISASGLAGFHTIEIPAASTADGGGAVIQSAPIAGQFRPDADISFPCIVTDNGVKVFGRVVVGSNGIITFSVGAAGGVFTNDAVAGWDRVSVMYGI